MIFYKHESTQIRKIHTVREKGPITHGTIAALHPVRRIVIIAHEILLVRGLVSDYCHSTHGEGLSGGAVRERVAFCARKRVLRRQRRVGGGAYGA